MRRHTLRSFTAYGWRERSSIVGAVLVMSGLVLLFTMTQRQIEEYSGRMLAIAGMLAAGGTVARGILGIVRNTTPPADPR